MQNVPQPMLAFPPDKTQLTFEISIMCLFLLMGPAHNVQGRPADVGFVPRCGRRFVREYSESVCR